MSSQVLYRKYRPQSFDQVIGQKDIIQSLSSQIESNTLSHAYLFFGTRGTGKTSIARIVGTTLSISPSDIYEIDAASNRGIDDVRALREAVRTSPLESKYKLYIIDEVHMLTKEAFNALLKTLEEPPAHVIFILATTELEKVPDTIISRCQVFTFSTPELSVLTEHIVDIAKQEGYSLSKEAAELIALSGGGSFRDALGGLQRVLTSINSKKITLEDVEPFLRVASKIRVHEFVEALLSEDREKTFSVIQKVSDASCDIPLFIKHSLELLRLLLLARFDSLNAKKDIESYDIKKSIDEIINRSPKLLQSKTLSRLITAYLESRSTTALGTLSLELAVVEIFEGN